MSEAAPFAIPTAQRYDPIAEIERRRRALDVSMRAVLDRAGVAASTWAHWRSSRHSPRMATVNKILAALDALAAETAARMRAVGYAPTAPPAEREPAAASS